HQAIMFYSMCVPTGAETGKDDGFWTIRSGFDTDELGIKEKDCRAAWTMDNSGEFHKKHLEKFQMPEKVADVYEKLGQGTPTASYVNHVNGSHPIGAVGAGGIMLMSSGMLFLVFGFISLVVVLVRAAMVAVMVYLFSILFI